MNSARVYLQYARVVLKVSFAEAGLRAASRNEVISALDFEMNKWAGATTCEVNCDIFARFISILYLARRGE